MERSKGVGDAVGDEHLQRCHQGREDSRRLEKELVGNCLQRKGRCSSVWMLQRNKASVVGVDELIVKAIQAMYDGATTTVRLETEAEEFGEKVGVHQGSVLLESTFIYHCPGCTI